MAQIITPQQLLEAYCNGYFPMAMEADDPELYWFAPEERGVLPLDAFNIPRGLKRAMKTRPYSVTVDVDFEAVIRACGSKTPTRTETWINETIVALYTELHRMGHAHSVEVWAEDRLVGGLYGVSIGGAFFGESMFSRAPDASKIALVTLVEILREASYGLLDTQYVNDHLLQFGVLAVEKAKYIKLLEKALDMAPDPTQIFSATATRILCTKMSS